MLYGEIAVIVANSEYQGIKHRYVLWQRSRVYLIIKEAGDSEC
jgi:hypothetical protein